MRLETRFPLSGDVLQSINPWSWFVRSLGQLGFININIGATPKPELEDRIVHEVASYGRQIGQMADALEVLVRERLEREPLDLEPPEVAALQNFLDLLAKVRAVKLTAETGR